MVGEGGAFNVLRVAPPTPFLSSAVDGYLLDDASGTTHLISPTTRVVVVSKIMVSAPSVEQKPILVGTTSALG